MLFKGDEAEVSEKEREKRENVADIDRINKNVDARRDDIGTAHNAVRNNGTCFFSPPRHHSNKKITN